ncbi:MAG: hypothetical protein WC619_02570 [Patescibacteria group bacterium]
MEKKKPAGPEMAERKRTLKGRQKEYPGRTMAWIGGILYFTDRNPPTEVPGVKELPKQGSAAIGLPVASRSASRRNVPPPPLQQRSQAVYYRDLPWARGTDGECCECYHYPNSKKIIVTEDRGRQIVVECGRCSTLMRPV